MIQAAGLRKAFGQLVAVDDLSFEVKAGECFGLLGPNGAGKSTTIAMLCGILKPDSGGVTVNGQPDPTRPEVRSQIGIAPQALSLYEKLSAEENLAFFGKMYELRGAKLAERVNWALEFAGLADRRKDRVGTYSGGMKRRLNLACALIHEPPVLFLDEPTAGVDPQSRNHLFDNIEQLNKQGLTVLYTTHYMEEAERLCDRVAVVDHGKLLALDTVRNLTAEHGGKPVVEVELEQPPADAAKLPGEYADGSLRIETDRPLDELAKLAQLGVNASSFRMRHPNLETVFLALTGRRLRD